MILRRPLIRKCGDQDYPMRLHFGAVHYDAKHRVRARIDRDAGPQLADNVQDRTRMPVHLNHDDAWAVVLALSFTPLREPRT